jgi:hypothetical protein
MLGLINDIYSNLYSSVVPSDEELKLTLRSLRMENPALGVAKTQALLLSVNPTWTVSEKRVRKGVHGRSVET